MFENKVALVTGASRGIGRDIAIALADKGAQVVVSYNNNAELAEKVVTEIKQRNGTAIAEQLSLPSRSSIKSLISRVKEKLGTIDILINNAAIAQEKPFETITDDDWSNMLAINLQGPFICTQEVLPEMIEKKWGRIINISSVGGQWGGFNQVHYAASKAALINFTQSIAKIYGKNNINSNCIAIGLVRTDMSSRELDSNEGKKKVAGIPAGRAGETIDVANAVTFLAGQGSDYINGQTINVNGGMYFG